MEKLGCVDLFTQPGIEFVREAWVSGKFGIARQASAIRLVEGEWPDLELKVDGKIEAFELVEADLPQRRRGQEYKQRAAQGGDAQHYPIEEWQAAAAQAPSAVRTAANKKAGKKYDGKAGLLIYLNINEFGIRQAEIEACLPAAVAPAAPQFESIWVLWKDKAIPVTEQPR